MAAARLTEAQRWGLLMLSVIVAFGGGLGLTLFVVVQNEHDRQADMCLLVESVYGDPDLPPPSNERGERQLQAARRYLERRC